MQEQSAHFDQHSNDEDDAIYGGLLPTHDAATIHVDTSDEENSSLSDEYSEPEDPFIYDSNASGESDGDDPLYQPGSSPLPSDDSPSDSDGGGDDDDIKEVDVREEKLDFLVNLIQRCRTKNHFSIAASQDMLDTRATCLALHNVPSEDILPLSTVHRIDQAHDDGRKRFLSNIGSIPVQSYAECSKCNALFKIKIIDNCNCGKSHSNLFTHKYNMLNQVTEDISVQCLTKKAPLSKGSKPCPKNLAILKKGKWEPCKVFLKTRIKDHLRLFWKGYGFSEQLKARFEFVKKMKTTGRMNFASPYWYDLEERIGTGV